MAASGMLNQLPDSLASLLAEAELAALWEACKKRQIRPRHPLWSPRRPSSPATAPNARSDGRRNIV